MEPLTIDSRMFEGAWRPTFAMLRTRTSNIPRCRVANSRSRFRIAARASAARDQCSRSWPAVGEQFVEQLQRVVVVVSASAHALQLFGELSTHARPRLGCWLQPASCVYKLIYWPSIWHNFVAVVISCLLLRPIYWPWSELSCWRICICKVIFCWVPVHQFWVYMCMQQILVSG
jgi:hypothetical protein